VRQFEINGSSGQTLPAFVFYPARKTGKNAARAYLDAADATVEIPSLAKNFHYQVADLSRLGTERAHSVLDAPPLRTAQKFPVVVFSHGFRSYPLQNTALFEDLASHGYIVITIAHPQDSVALQLRSGVVVPTFEPLEKETSYLEAKNRICCGPTFADRTAAVEEFARRLAPTRLGQSVGAWRENMLATLRYIRAGSWPAEIAEVMRQADVDNCALTGMSFGGDVAASTCRLAESCRAAINMDGWPYDVSTIDSDAGRPVLMLTSDWLRFPVPGQPTDPGYNVTDLAFERWQQAGRNPHILRLRIDGLRHMGLTDLLALLEGPDKSNYVGDADPATAMTAINAVSRAFLDTYLKGAPGDRVQAVLSAHPNLHRRSADSLRVWATHRTDEIQIAPKTVREDVFPRPPVSFAGGVVALPDVEYANLAGFRPLLLDLYLPPGSTGPRPLVLVIHGGGWSRGDSRTWGAIADYPATLAMLTARGYVVASVNYRLSGEARFPAQIQDVKAAIRFLRANAAQYHIDPARILAWGGSAGGHLAALAATSCGVAAFAPLPSTGRLPNSAAQNATLPEGSDCVQGAVIWFGVFDLKALPGKNTESLLGCAFASCASALEVASPIRYVTASTTPMLLIHGLADTQVPAEQSRQMAKRLEEAGSPVETLFIPDVDHGFLGKTPDDTRRANLLALEHTFEFIERFFATK
jgi:acetyl esterase/lipase